MRNFDPTREEMIAHLESEQFCLATGYTQFDIEAAIYWFAADYHGGQWSNLYSALSTSKYTPGRLMTDHTDEGEIVEIIYSELEAEFIMHD